MCFIIQGSKGVTTHTGFGEFFCPVCQVRREYRRKKMRKFITLYFIPVIPSGKKTDYIQCGTCGNAFDPEVLNMRH